MKENIRLVQLVHPEQGRRVALVKEPCSLCYTMLLLFTNLRWMLSTTANAAYIGCIPHFQRNTCLR